MKQHLKRVIDWTSLIVSNRGGLFCSSKTRIELTSRAGDHVRTDLTPVCDLHYPMWKILKKNLVLKNLEKKKIKCQREEGDCRNRDRNIPISQILVYWFHFEQKISIFLENRGAKQDIKFFWFFLIFSIF